MTIGFMVTTTKHYDAMTLSGWLETFSERTSINSLDQIFDKINITGPCPLSVQ